MCSPNATKINKKMSLYVGLCFIISCLDCGRTHRFALTISHIFTHCIWFFGIKKSPCRKTRGFYNLKTKDYSALSVVVSLSFSCSLRSAKPSKSPRVERSVLSFCFLTASRDFFWSSFSTSLTFSSVSFFISP